MHYNGRLATTGGNMRMNAMGMVALLISVPLATADGQAGGAMVVRQRAPTDRAVAFSLSALQAEFSEMDLRKIETVRLLEGGTYNVNIRHLTAAEMPLIHAKKADVW